MKGIYVYKNQTLNNKETKIDYRNKDNLAGHIKRDINLAFFSLSLSLDVKSKFGSIQEHLTTEVDIGNG